MPLLSSYAQKRKIGYFLTSVPKDARILDVGCGSGWVGKYLKEHGWKNYVGLDLLPPADVVGDIRDWRELGLEAYSFDILVAFEVVEHVDCWQACHDLLKPGGKLLVTTPVPHRDWILLLLESVGLNLRRTSPHDFLVYVDKVPHFRDKKIRIVAGLSQWAVLTASNGFADRTPNGRMRSEADIEPPPG